MGTAVIGAFAELTSRDPQMPGDLDLHDRADAPTDRSERTAPPLATP